MLLGTQSPGSLKSGADSERVELSNLKAHTSRAGSLFDRLNSLLVFECEAVGVVGPMCVLRVLSLS